MEAAGLERSAQDDEGVGGRRPLSVGIVVDDSSSVERHGRECSARPYRAGARETPTRSSGDGSRVVPPVTSTTRHGYAPRRTADQEGLHVPYRGQC
jgi:hypothetical protein